MAVDPIGTNPAINAADRKFFAPKPAAKKPSGVQTPSQKEPAPAEDAKNGARLEDPAKSPLLPEDREAVAREAESDKPDKSETDKADAKWLSARPDRKDTDLRGKPIDDHRPSKRPPGKRPNGSDGADRAERARAERMAETAERNRLADKIGVESDEVASRSGTNSIKIRDGENLTKIADRFGLSVDELLEHNDISDPDDIKAGDRLEIPAWAEAPEADTRLDAEAEHSNQRADRQDSLANALSHESPEVVQHLRNEAHSESERAATLEMADEVIEDLMARGMVELAQQLEDKIAEGDVTFVDEDELGLDGASAVYDASEGMVLIPVSDLENAVEANKAFGTTNNRFMATLVDGLVHELAHHEHHEAGTDHEDSVVIDAAANAAAQLERFESLPLTAEDYHAAKDGVTADLVSTYNGEFEIDAYRAGELARFEAGYDAPLSGWMTIDDSGNPLSDDVAHANVDAHVGENAELMHSLAGNLVEGAESPAWRRPDDASPAWRRPDDASPAWRRPEDANPAWRRPEDANPAWRRPEGANPAWRRPEDANPAWRRPEDANPAWRRPEDANPAWRRPEDANPAWRRPESANA